MVYKTLKFIKRYIDLVLAPFHRLLYRLGLRPIHLTLLSLPTGLAGVYLIPYNPFWAGSLVFAYLLLDVLDGSLARCTGSVTKLGDRLDFLFDRLVALAFLLSLYFVSGEKLFSVTGFIFLTAVTLEDLGLIKR